MGRSLVLGSEKVVLDPKSPNHYLQQERQQEQRQQEQTLLDPNHQNHPSSSRVLQQQAVLPQQAKHMC